MARFEVYRLDKGYVLDCQTDILGHLNSRFVVPLLPVGEAPRPAARLNPLFELDGALHVMVTQFAATVSARDLGPALFSLAEHDTAILNALDLLITGI